MPNLQTSITSNNTLRAVDFLLALDNSAIMENYRKEAYRWIRTLNEAYLRHYQRSHKDYWIWYSEDSRPFIMKESLDSLRRTILHCTRILTDEAQDKLAEFLSDPDAEPPKSSFDEEEYY